MEKIYPKISPFPLKVESVNFYKYRPKKDLNL